MCLSQAPAVSTGNPARWENSICRSIHRLIDAGDQSASGINVIVNGATGAMEPLSDFTTQTTEQLDSDRVDFGYHYVPPIASPTAPQLTTGCLSYGIALNWSFTGGLPIQNFEIYRSTSQSGTYSHLATVSADFRFYVDKSVHGKSKLLLSGDV